jgi:PAS domain S-box-containing protein
VSSLQRKSADLVPEEVLSSDGKACWQFLSCPKVLCPCHGRQGGLECWLTPRTRCGESIENDLLHKLPSCLGCAYFRHRVKNLPGPPDQFLSEQIRRYIFVALEQIYQKEESFIEILDRIPDGLFTTDEEWRITYFNPAAEKITGFSAEDAVGMYCRDVFKNPICETDCALKRAVADGSNILNREYEITNIEGKRIPIICSTSAFRDRNGRVTGGLEIFKDIKETKRLQEEVASREKKYRRIFEGSHDMIYTTNRRGDILDINEAGLQMLGYGTKEELLAIGTAKRLYKRTSDRKKFLKAIDREGFVKDFEVDFKRKKGTPIHVLISSRRYENPDTRDVEFEGIIKDITQRKRSEDLINERNRELSILNRVAVALNLTMDLEHILLVTLKEALKILRLRRGAIFLIDREEGRINLHVSHGLPANDGKKPTDLFFKDVMLMRHLIGGEGSLSPKPTFPPFQVGYETVPGAHAIWLSCFLITSKGKGVGFFGFDIPSSRVLSPHETHLLGSLGNFLGGGIENAQLMKTIRLHRQELSRLTEKLFKSQEAERRRIARELHDEAGQALTAVKLGLDRLEQKLSAEDDHLKEEVEEIRRMLTGTASEIRRISYRLHPTLLSDLGLEPALSLLFKDIAQRSGLHIDFRMVGFDHRIDADTETVLYRFGQEAITNTLKHARAKRFSLSIIKSYPKIIFIAEDDGSGFNGEIGGSDKWSLGLLGMRERASLLGGSFNLKTAPGEGARLRIEIPLRGAYNRGTTH